MKKRNLIFIIIVLAFSYVVINFASPFFRDYTKQFLKKYGDADFDDFKGTSFVVRSMRGKEIHCYGSQHSITNGVIWFDINCDTYEYLSDSPRYTPSEDSLNQEEKESLLELKPLFPTFAKYRVRQLTVDEKGNVLIAIVEPSSVNLIKPKLTDSIPEKYKDRIKRRVGNWYVLKEK